MAPAVAAEPVPLATDSDGVMRIGGTRVTLDTLVSAFHDGATAETIVEQYPSLQLAAVYTVIGYYLQHEAEVRGYLERRRQEGAMARQENETRFDPLGIRGRLLARRSPLG
jgi:uncharacterized protein (DUF433 family)